MPVKIWEVDEQGLSSVVVTGWDTLWTAEEHREEAEELDQVLDAVLDDAVARVDAGEHRDVPTEFLRAWAVGRALAESGVLDAPALRNERRELLWRALARKCRTGARYTLEREERWAQLRPRSAGEPRREGGRLDYFEMCRWLAEQDLEDAAATFGGHVRNVWQMLERPTLRPLGLRRALRAWIEHQPERHRGVLFEPKVFAEAMKALRKRWPDRGPGSAKRPIHYSEEALGIEVAKVLAPVVQGLSAAMEGRACSAVMRATGRAASQLRRPRGVGKRPRTRPRRPTLP